MVAQQIEIQTQATNMGTLKQGKLESVEDNLDDLLSVINIDEIKKATGTLAIKIHNHDATWATIENQVVNG